MQFILARKNFYTDILSKNDDFTHYICNVLFMCYIITINILLFAYDFYFYA